MRSTSDQYFAKLDHVRALAVLLVFSWHFLNFQTDRIGGVSSLPVVAFFTQGHFGVSLFMTLSGYLFAKILAGQDIVYGRFIWNRVIRLGPLLAGAMAASLLKALLDDNFAAQLLILAKGFVLPVWPNGGWSIATELHFYAILPLLLLLDRKNRNLPLMILGAAILTRLVVYLITGDVQKLAYFTILGRIDQFLLGIYFFGVSRTLTNRHRIALGAFVALAMAYAGLSLLGGFHGAAKSPLWVIWPTVDALPLGILTAYYDRSDIALPAWIGKPAAIVGQCSYSFYILHFWYFPPVAARLQYLLDMSHLGVAFAACLVAFAAFVPAAWLSYRFIEQAALRYRVDYRNAPTEAVARAVR